MISLDPSTWTGRKERPAFAIPAADVAVLERPAGPVHPKSGPLIQSDVDAMHEAAMLEYAELADVVGIMPPDLNIERFKAFLRSSNMPVYQLADVVSYMDDKAAKESKEQSGWEWRPLRAKDNRDGMAFGRAAERTGTRSDSRVISIPASDYYRGPREERQSFNQLAGMSWIDSSGRSQISAPSQVTTYTVPASSKPYDRTIPIHAVRKVAQIEKGFGGDVAFFVTDYALAPAIQYPDPFLMVVVPNPKVNIGTGRFIIDFWDEPGFGIEHQLKSDL